MIFAQTTNSDRERIYPHPLEEKLGGDDVPEGGEADPAEGGSPGVPEDSGEVGGDTGGEEEEELGVGGVREALMRPSPRPPRRYR